MVESVVPVRQEALESDADHGAPEPDPALRPASRRRTRHTIGETFSPRRNSLNFLRVVLALGVIVDHALGLGYFPSVPNFVLFNHKTDLGSTAVYSFFAISGFLICRSALSRRTVKFVWQRFLRIFPGFGPVSS